MTVDVRSTDERPPLIDVEAFFADLHFANPSISPTAPASRVSGPDRFVRWPVHAEIARTWRGKVGIGTDSWQAGSFEPQQALERARNTLERPHADDAA